jgi:hypothetical protein
MGGTVSQLLQVLGDSIERYNSNVIGKIKNNLANDVIVYRSTPGPFEKYQEPPGKDPEEFKGDKAIKELEDEYTIKPQFTVVNLEIDLHGAYDGEATEATITGTAAWKDTNDNGRTLRFRFECSFESKDKNSEARWLFREISSTNAQTFRPPSGR